MLIGVCRLRLQTDSPIAASAFVPGRSAGLMKAGQDFRNALPTFEVIRFSVREIQLTGSLVFFIPISRRC
jgi:hypothetical protein